MTTFLANDMKEEEASLCRQHVLYPQLQLVFPPHFLSPLCWLRITNGTPTLNPKMEASF
jgi:hypothetical protein